MPSFWLGTFLGGRCSSKIHVHSAKCFTCFSSLFVKAFFLPLQMRMPWAQLPHGSLISQKDFQFRYTIYFCLPGAEFNVLLYVKVVVLPNVFRPRRSYDWDYLRDFLLGKQQGSSPWVSFMWPLELLTNRARGRMMMLPIFSWENFFLC